MLHRAVQHFHILPQDTMVVMIRASRHLASDTPPPAPQSYQPVTLNAEHLTICISPGGFQKSRRPAHYDSCTRSNWCVRKHFMHVYAVGRVVAGEEWRAAHQL
jgi:hypothetical protein